MKRALLVGINKYVMPGCDLRGCINDVEEYEPILKVRFKFDQITKLINENATTENIKEAVWELIANTQAGDVAHLVFSGHGSQVPDNREADGFSEVLCPHDFNFDDKLVKDDFFHESLKDFPELARFVALFDSCHSGDCLRSVNYNHRQQRFIVNPSLPPFLVARKQFASDYRGVLISGCLAEQTSADAYIDGRWIGAFSHFRNQVIREISETSDLTYWNLMWQTRKKLKEAGYDQVPQLDCVAKKSLEIFLEPPDMGSGENNNIGE